MIELRESLEDAYNKLYAIAEGVYAKLTKLLNEIVNDPETREALFTITRAIRRYGAIPNFTSIIRREYSVRPGGTVLSTAKIYNALQS